MAYGINLGCLSKGLPKCGTLPHLQEPLAHLCHPQGTLTHSRVTLTFLFHPPTGDPYSPASPAYLTQQQGTVTSCLTDVLGHLGVIY